MEGIIALLSICEPGAQQSAASAALSEALNNILLQVPIWDDTQKAAFVEHLVVSGVLSAVVQAPVSKHVNQPGLPHQQLWGTLVQLLCHRLTTFTQTTLEYLGSEQGQLQCPVVLLPITLRLAVWDSLESVWLQWVRSNLAQIEPMDFLTWELIQECCGVPLHADVLPSVEGRTTPQPATTTESTSTLSPSDSFSSFTTVLSTFHRLWTSSSVHRTGRRLRDGISVNVAEMAQNLQPTAGNKASSSTARGRPQTPSLAQLPTAILEVLKARQEALLDRAVVELQSHCCLSGGMLTAAAVQAQSLTLSLLYLEDDLEEVQARCVQEALQKPTSVADVSVSFFGVDESTILPSTVLAMSSPVCVLTLCFTVFHEASLLTPSQLEADGFSPSIHNAFHWLRVALRLPEGAEDPSHWCHNDSFTAAFVKMISTDCFQSKPAATKSSLRIRTAAHYKFLQDSLKGPDADAAAVTRVSATRLQLRSATDPGPVHKGSLRGLGTVLTAYYIWMLRRVPRKSDGRGVTFQQTGLKHFAEKVSPLLVVSSGSQSSLCTWDGSLIACVERGKASRGQGLNDGWVEPETSHWFQTALSSVSSIS